MDDQEMSIKVENIAAKILEANGDTKAANVFRVARRKDVDSISDADVAKWKASL